VNAQGGALLVPQVARRNFVQDPMPRRPREEEVLPWVNEVSQHQPPVSATRCAAQCASATFVTPSKVGPRVPELRLSARKGGGAPGQQRRHGSHGQSPRRHGDGRAFGAEKDWQQIEVPEAAYRPLCQTRFCIAGLLTLSALRGCAVSIYNSPAGLAWTAHMLSCSADVIAMLGALPVLFTRAIGACVHHRCLGSLLTLLLTATVCDFGAAVIFLSTAGGVFRLMGPVATDEGAPPGFAFVGVWECILLSSVSLEFALCTSAWQFYRAFREAGIYPPNAHNIRVHKDVSPLEFLCEAEDVALLSDQCNACTRRPSSLTDEAADGIVDMNFACGEAEELRLTSDVRVAPELPFSALARGSKC